MRETPVSLHAALLLIAVCYGIFAQGAFYGSQLLILESLLVIGFLAALRQTPPSRADFTTSITTAGLLMVLVLFVSAARAASLAQAMPQAAFLLVLVATSLTTRRIDRVGQEALLQGIAVATAIIALLGWLAVATHAEPGALINGALWRASTTVSYANAAACLFAMVALTTLSRAASTDSLVAEYLSFAALVGLGSTLSRGAILGFLLALGFAFLSGGRTVITKEWHVLAAAFIAIAGLLPSISAKGPPHLLPAILALLASASIVGLRHVVRPRHLASGLLAVALCASVALVVTRPRALDEGLEQLSSARFARDISVRDRQARWATFLDIARADPVFGAGPGGFLLRYPNPTKLDVGLFAHNEYLQILAEQGLVGVTALAASIGMMARDVLRARKPDWIWTGSSSALVVFLVQGATDFVWNVPLTPVVAAIFVTTASAPATQREQQSIASAPPRP